MQRILRFCKATAKTVRVHEAPASILVHMMERIDHGGHETSIIPRMQDDSTEYVLAGFEQVMGGADLR